MSVRVGGTTLLAVTLVLLGPVDAIAQDDGVFIDPDSPTAKQYRIPVESARRQADPEGDGKLAPPGGRPAGTTAAPLFGEGIEATAAGAKSRSDKQRAKSNSDKPSSSSAGSSGESGADPLKAAVQNPGAPSGGVGAPLLIAGGAALVLLLGTLVGLLLRRRRAD